ncbi:hypothetical protein BC829DRAFT_430832 [Chytridium lagenaria]|nr:hypothetical protein BC829DRAFT_430832 [Chytridium lagenaria]
MPTSSIPHIVLPDKVGVNLHLILVRFHADQISQNNLNWFLTSWSSFGDDDSPNKSNRHPGACQQKQRPLLPHVVSTYLELCNKLHIDGDKLKRDEEWEPILKALKTNTDLGEIHIFSDALGSEARHAADKIRRGEEDTAFSRKINEALCIPVQLLGKGLVSNGTIRKLSLSRCGIGDSGLVISRIWYSKSKSSPNSGPFGLCPHSGRCCTSFGFAKSQAVQRQAALWETTLRAHPSDPLREGYVTKSVNAPLAETPTLHSTFIRVNLSCNCIGDDGCTAIMESLREEMGLLALDLQMNGITDAGGRFVEQMVKINGEVMIVDIRNNKIDRLLQNIIFEKLDRNTERALELNNINAKRITNAQTDLFWLDPEYPLLCSFFDIVSRHSPPNASVRHTISSLKKRSFPKPTAISRPASSLSSGSIKDSLQNVRSDRLARSRRGSARETKQPLPLKRANSPTRLPQVAWEPPAFTQENRTPLVAFIDPNRPKVQADKTRHYKQHAMPTKFASPKIKFYDLASEQPLPEDAYSHTYDAHGHLVDERLHSLEMENIRLKETIADILTSQEERRTQRSGFSASPQASLQRHDSWVKVDGIEFFEEDLQSSQRNQPMQPAYELKSYCDGDDSDLELQNEDIVQLTGAAKTLERNEAADVQETLLSILEQSLRNFHAFMDKLDMMEEQRT